MNDQQRKNPTGSDERKGPDPATAGMGAFFEAWAQAAEKGQEMMAQWLGQNADAMKQATAKAAPESAAFAEALAKAKTDPAKVMQAQMALWQGYQQLWLNTTRRLLTQEPAEAVAKPAADDRRFRHPDWSENPYFDFLKQSYLLNADWLKKTLLAVEGLDPDTARKIDFYSRQMIDALSPTNFALTNPEVLRETAEKKGENLVRGMENLMADMKRGNGRPSIRQTDMTAFEVGRNVATTPGKVVFQNDLIQLIQYTPTTAQVFARPLLIMPPWINKFYILDLQPENSFVRWALDSGYSVFLISWVNPDARLKDKGFDDYMTEGPLAALDAIEQATAAREVTAIGYCIGGTLLAATLAWMAAKGDHRIKAATFFAAQVDFTDAGELRVFTDEAQVKMLEDQVKRDGYLDGAAMAWTFNMLRANDLIWSFVINNYLMGRDPPAFDLLYWNADSTRMPARMMLEYLRKMYQQNLLAKPGGMDVNGVPIDLHRIEVPVFFQATREDHIAPFRSVYKAMNIFGGPKTFALAGSGHIAGIINPPHKNKYQHWINESDKAYPDADAWLAEATERAGSWWPYWHDWNRRRSGKKVKARVPGSGKLKPIEDAPGSYVRVKT